LLKKVLYEEINQKNERVFRREFFGISLPQYVFDHK
jgi:hypothetical protein